jgi:hypothetical protein
VPIFVEEWQRFCEGSMSAENIQGLKTKRLDIYKFNSMRLCHCDHLLPKGEAKQARRHPNKGTSWRLGRWQQWRPLLQPNSDLTTARVCRSSIYARKEGERGVAHRCVTNVQRTIYVNTNIPRQNVRQTRFMREMCYAPSRFCQTVFPRRKGRSRDAGGSSELGSIGVRAIPKHASSPRGKAPPPAIEGSSLPKPTAIAELQVHSPKQSMARHCTLLTASSLGAGRSTIRHSPPTPFSRPGATGPFFLPARVRMRGLPGRRWLSVFHPLMQECFDY